MKRLFLSSIFISATIVAFAQASVREKQDYGGEAYYVYNYSEEDAMRYHSTSTDLDPIEGIWIGGPFKLSIEKDFDGSTRSNRRYRAVVLCRGYGSEAQTKKWIFFFLEKTRNPKEFHATFYFFTAVWSRGQRNYTIKPYSSFPRNWNLGDIILTMYTPTLLEGTVPGLDDRGKVDETDEETFYKVFPGVY
ncbi:MAG: hypothetical protein IKH52_04395 [Bacteroidaceae bacterium]|nr:hypothetical protein [Bacteroidaceae bacterium]MBR6926431.1 hypothetical protein [Bacteroidaceae bacterium]